MSFHGQTGKFKLTLTYLVEMSIGTHAMTVMASFIGSPSTALSGRPSLKELNPRHHLQAQPQKNQAMLVQMHTR